MYINMNLLSESATHCNTIEKKLFVIVKQWCSFCRTFNAKLLSIYAAYNIRKIPSFLKLNSCVQKPVMVRECQVLRWQLGPENFTNLIHYFSKIFNILIAIFRLLNKKRSGLRCVTVTFTDLWCTVSNNSSRLSAFLYLKTEPKTVCAT